MFEIMDRLGRTLDRRGIRGRLRKTFLYVIWKWIRAFPMVFDYRMVNLYSRKSFRDQLDDTECSNWISMWLQSYQKPPETLVWVLGLKDPVPWINFKAIHYIEFFLQDRNRPSVFEYGSGASTLWFAKRAEKVVSVESDERWHGHLTRVFRDKKVDNVDYFLERAEAADDSDRSLDEYRSFFRAFEGMHFRNYVQKIQKDGELYDLIFIDGEARTACLKLAIEKIKEDGIIVLDNSARERYQSAITAFKDREILRFTGPVSYGEVVDETTIFYRKKA